MKISLTQNFIATSCLSGVWLFHYYYRVLCCYITIINDCYALNWENYHRIKAYILNEWKFVVLTLQYVFSIKSDKGGPPAWHDYFLCGLKGILETLPSDISPTGIIVVLTGNIPPGSGLSSSSALVCAAALAMARAHQVRLSSAVIFAKWSIL